MLLETLYVVALYASVAVFAATAGFYLWTGRASMFHPATIYLAFHGVTFVLRPIVAYYGHYDTIYIVYQFWPSWSDKLVVLLPANLGCIVFVGGSLYFGRERPRFDPEEFSLERSVRALLITCLITAPIAIYSMVAMFTGQQQTRLDYATGIAVNTTGSGYLFDAQLMLATLTGMIAFVFRFRLLSLLPAVAFVVFRASSGGRGPFIAAIFFLVLLYLYSRRRRWITATTGVLAVVALGLFRIVGDDRGASIQSALGFVPAVRQVTELRFLESMDWANLEFFEYLAHTVPSKTGTFDYFLSLLQLFTEPIPRTLWDGKPIGAPIKLFNLFDYGFPIGMTYSLPGAGWIELGWGGVIILCLVFAWIYGRAYDRFMTSAQTPFAVMFYCAFATTSIVAFRDGLILTILKQAMFYLAPVLVYRLVDTSLAFGSDHRPEAKMAAKPTPLTTPKERRLARMHEL